jgi:phosphoribosylcarboxyaminoimidazole (NCAIR) mutase
MATVLKQQPVYSSTAIAQIVHNAAQGLNAMLEYVQNPASIPVHAPAMQNAALASSVMQLCNVLCSQHNQTMICARENAQK